MAARCLVNLRNRIRPYVYEIPEVQTRNYGPLSMGVTSDALAVEVLPRRKLESGIKCNGRRGIFSWAGRPAQNLPRFKRTEFFRNASTSSPSESVAADSQKESQSNDEKQRSTEQEEELDEKTRTLSAALAHVPKLGWTEAAIAAGARDVGLSPAIVGAFPRKEAALVEFFMEECAQALAEELEPLQEELEKLVTQERIARIVWMRLEMQVPYLSKWAQALSIQANPLNAPTALKQRAQLVDDIWHFAGDRSAEMDWYAKRFILGGVYSTTELYMLTDTSPGFRDTKAFLERRIKDAVECRKTVQEAGHFSQTVRAGLENTIFSYLNRKPPSGFGF